MLCMRLLIILLLLAPTQLWADDPSADIAARVETYIAQLNNPDANVRSAAIEALGRMGPPARAAIPDLVTTLSDTANSKSGVLSSAVQSIAYRALFDIGLESTPALTIAVDSKDPVVSRHAIDCLAQFGPRARTALNPIAKIADSREHENHLTALLALGRIDHDGNIAIPILERAVTIIANDRNHSAEYAVMAMQNYPQHPRTLPILLSCLASKDSEVRGNAVLSLENVPDRSGKVTSALLPLLYDKGVVHFFCVSPSCAFFSSGSVAHLVPAALAKQNASANQVVPELLKEVQALIAADDPTQLLSPRGLLQDIVKFDPLPPKTASRIFELYEQAVKRQRHAISAEGRSDFEMFTELTAITCLVRIPAQTRELLPKFEALFQSTDAYTRYEAAVVLAALDPRRYPEALRLVESVIDVACDRIDSSSEEEETASKKKLQERQLSFFPKGWEFELPIVGARALLTNPLLLERYASKLHDWNRNDLIRWDDPILIHNLQRLSPQAELNVTELLEHYETKDIRNALFAMGPRIVPRLVADTQQRLDESDLGEGVDQDNGDEDKHEVTHERSPPESLTILAEMGEDAATAWPVLLRFAKSDQPLYRIAAIEALAKIRSLHYKSLPHLVALLKDSNCRVRAAAATGLGQYADNVMLPALAQAAQDEYADVRASAVESLTKLGLDRPAVRDALEKAQSDSHPYVKLIAQEALLKTKK